MSGMRQSRHAVQLGKEVKIGSLCTGYGGLDMAVEKYFSAQTAWVCEIDKYASQVIEQRIQKPNLGDLKTVDWSKVEPIDILTAGYPCQPFSHAGYRKGDQDERHLWPHISKVIGLLRPTFVILENVRGHLSLGFADVLADLTQIGYDARWEIVRASDVGAPHKRERLFVIAYSNGTRLQRRSKTVLSKWEVDGGHGKPSLATNSDGNARTQPRRADRGISSSPSEVVDGRDWQVDRSGDKTLSDTDSQHQSHDGQVPKLGSRFATRFEMSVRVAPDTLVDGKLNAAFVEYMMGLPAGWVTDSGLSRAQQLKMLGNGVVPQQAYYAIELLMSHFDTPFDTEKR